MFAGAAEMNFGTSVTTTLRTFCASLVTRTTSFAFSSESLDPALVSSSILSTSAWTVWILTSLPSEASRALSSLSEAEYAFFCVASSCCAPVSRPWSCAKAPARPPVFFSRALRAMAFFASAMPVAAAFSAAEVRPPASLSSARGSASRLSADTDSGSAASLSSRTFASHATRASKAAPRTSAYLRSKVWPARSLTFFETVSSRSIREVSRSAAAFAAPSASCLASVCCFLTLALAWAIVASARLWACSTAETSLGASSTSPSARKGCSAFS
mmetsp:Transcript_149036/g.379157  ORF Transcript_149036/g.379157 Transcript_149036/m.379157 type:complete len:272 (+) Transcript_149036:3541-4356(+)